MSSTQTSCAVTEHKWGGYEWVAGSGTVQLWCCHLYLHHTNPQPTMPCFTVATSIDFWTKKSEQWQSFRAHCALSSLFCLFSQEGHYKNKHQLKPQSNNSNKVNNKNKTKNQTNKQTKTTIDLSCVFCHDSSLKHTVVFMVMLLYYSHCPLSF